MIAAVAAVAAPAPAPAAPASAELAAGRPSTPIDKVPPFYTAPPNKPMAAQQAVIAGRSLVAVGQALASVQTLSQGHDLGVWNALRTAGGSLQVGAHMAYSLRPATKLAAQDVYDKGTAIRDLADVLDHQHYTGGDRVLTIGDRQALLHAVTSGYSGAGQLGIIVATI